MSQRGPGVISEPSWGSGQGDDPTYLWAETGRTREEAAGRVCLAWERGGGELIRSKICLKDRGQVFLMGRRGGRRW